MSEETQNTSNESTKAESKNVYDNIPTERFDKVIGERNDARKLVSDLQSQVAKLVEDNKVRENAELEKKGEYKELLDKTKSELEQYKAKAEQFDTYQNSRRESLMKQIVNEDDKAIADGLSLDKLEKFVNRVSVSSNSVRSTTSRPKTLGEKINVKNESDIWDMDSKERKGNWSAILNSFAKNNK